MDIEDKPYKLEVLLHYDKSFREDWRLLHRLRILVGSFYIGAAIALIGWLAKYGATQESKETFIYLLTAISIAAIVSMGWFGSSMNTLKRLIVKIERALKLMESGVYLPGESIIQVNHAGWGDHSLWSWGKGVFAALILSVFFVVVLIKIKTNIV